MRSGGNRPPPPIEMCKKLFTFFVEYKNHLEINVELILKIKYLVMDCQTGLGARV
jgi:hypothetical protein